LLLGGSIWTVMAAAAIWLVLTLSVLVRAAGGSVPHGLEIVCGTIAAPVALAAAGHAIASLWRGPTILSFSRADSDTCTPDEAAYVRFVAQHRGTMGGAGFLHPGRVLLPAGAWIAAAAEGAALASIELEPWAFAAIALAGVGAAAATLLFPARPFFYREATGGTAIVSPPSVARDLKARAKAWRAALAGAETPTTPQTPVPLVGLGAQGTGSRDPAA
jgi:hypothetical protein